MFDLDHIRKMLLPGLFGSIFQAQIYMSTLSSKRTGICHESLCMISDQELDNSHTSSNLKKRCKMKRFKANYNVKKFVNCSLL